MTIVLRIILASSVLAWCALRTPAQFSWTGSQPGEQYGFAVTFLGDLDGDGADSIAIGAPLHMGPTGLAGRVEVRGIWTGVDYTLDGEWFGDQFGSTVSSIPDIDGDQVRELVVGAWGNSQGGLLAGKVYLFSGATGALIWARAGFPEERFGFSIADAGDTLGNGVPSIVVGAPGASSDTGAAYVLSSLDGSVIASFFGDSPGDLFGHAVSAAGRIGGDPLPDILVSAPFWNNGVGRVYAYSPALNVQHAIVGGSPNSLFGYSIAGFPDLTGDGRDDFLVGIPAALVGGQAVGSASIRETLNWTNALSTWSGNQANEAFGSVVRNIGDWSGDGIDDAVLGSPAWNSTPGSNQGRITISSTNGPPLLQQAGEQAGERFGSAIAGHGDFNGDGAIDVIIGAPLHHTASGPNVGRVALLSSPGIGTYGVGAGGLNTMTLDGSGGTRANDLLTLDIMGGVPGTLGSLWIALQPDYAVITFPAGPATQLINLGTVWPDIPFLFDANGRFVETWALLPAVVAPLAGQTLYLQAASINLPLGTCIASNGLMLTLGN